MATADKRKIKRRIYTTRAEATRNFMLLSRNK